MGESAQKEKRVAFKELTSGLEPDIISGLGGHTKKGVANPVTITGYYFGAIQRPKKDKPGEFQSVYLFKTETKLVGIWGVGNMGERLAPAKLGNKVRLTFKEARPTKNGGEFKIYSAEEDADDHIDPPAQAAPQMGPAKQAPKHSDLHEEDIPF